MARHQLAPTQDVFFTGTGFKHKTLGSIWVVDDTGSDLVGDVFFLGFLFGHLFLCLRRSVADKP